MEVQPSEPLVTNEAEPLPFDESQNGELIMTRDVAALSPKWSSIPYYFSAKLGGSNTHINNIQITPRGKDGLYLPGAHRLGHGALINTNIVKSVLMTGVAVGYNWETQGFPLRTEIEYAFRDDISYFSNTTYWPEPVNGMYPWFWLRHQNERVLTLHTPLL